MIARLTETLIVALWQRNTLALVLAGRRKASITFGQDLTIDFALANEILRWC